jgi:hypothetical protein
MYDIFESQGRLGRVRGHHPELLQELNLDVSTEELLSAETAFTYADLYATLRNRDTVAWLTPHTAVVREGDRGVVKAWGQLHGSCGFCCSADGKDIIALARSPEHLLEICDVVFRLLAVSVVHSVILSTRNSLDGALINAPSLAYLMEQCQSLKALALNHVEMDEDHCRVLGAYSRPGLEIELKYCKITSTGARALAEILRRNQGPTKLDWCEIDNFFLADGLYGSSRLKSLKLRVSSTGEAGDRESFTIAGALRENKGLVDLEFRNGLMKSDEAWGAICDSLETHPTLEVLGLRGTFMYGRMAPAVLKSRIQAILGMMEMNLSIHTIHLPVRLSEHELFQESVVPYLVTNRFRPRLLAIQKTCPITYRAKVLGRALLSARTDPNHLWMLLSGNAEVALFPSTTAATTPAVNLPTPATAAVPSTENVAAVAATPPTSTEAVSTISVSAFDSVATPMLD